MGKFFFFFFGQRRDNYSNCASRGKFGANEFFKIAYKISILRPAFLTCANEHYAANLRSVNAQLCAQSCPSIIKTQGTSLPEGRLQRLLQSQLSWMKTSELGYKSCFDQYTRFEWYSPISYIIPSFNRRGSPSPLHEKVQARNDYRFLPRSAHDLPRRLKTNRGRWEFGTSRVEPLRRTAPHSLGSQHNISSFRFCILVRWTNKRCCLLLVLQRRNLFCVVSGPWI